MYPGLRSVPNLFSNSTAFLRRPSEPRPPARYRFRSGYEPLTLSKIVDEDQNPTLYGQPKVGHLVILCLPILGILPSASGLYGVVTYRCMDQLTHLGR